MPVFFLSLPELRSGASHLSGPRGSRWSACVWMSLHAFVSLPPCRLFIISASSFLSPPMFPCTFLRLLLAVAPVSPHLRLCLPRIFFLLAFPCLPTRLPQHLLRTFPRCLLIFLASSSFLPSPPASFLSAFPRLLLAASTSTPVSSPLRFPSPSGNSSLLRLGAFPLTGILFVLFQVRGFVEVRALLLRQAGGAACLCWVLNLYI